MHANDIAFGIEIETHLPGHDTTPIGGYHNGLPVAWLPEGWKAERDSSIRTPVGRKNAEFVSPILRGYDGLQNVERAVDAIKARGARVNESCGLHITITWNGDAAALARLISLIGNHERAIYASTGTKRRERNTWAKQIKSYGNKDAAKRNCEADRYHLLNLTHLARGRNRIEIRAFVGTLNKTKLLGYIQMVLGLAELALTTRRCSGWEYTKRPGTKSCWDRNGAGEGETELNRLYYRLGWTIGWRKGALRTKRYGELSAGEQTCDWKPVKKKLLQMARKYDQAV